MPCSVWRVIPVIDVVSALTPHYTVNINDSSRANVTLTKYNASNVFLPILTVSPLLLLRGSECFSLFCCNFQD